MPEPTISILLPCYKSGDLMTAVFMSGFLKHSNPKTTQLILCDNGGNPSFKTDFFDKLVRFGYDIKIIGDGTNIGLNKGLNKCAEVATGTYYYLCHNDMYLMPSWDTTLLQAAKNQPPTSFLMCSRSVEPTLGHTKHHIIKNYGMEASEFKEEELLKDFENYKDLTIEVGARMPFFMHRKLWEKMKGVDEKYFSYCTDDDLIQTAWHVRLPQILNGV